jgi:hypothetical protein
LPTARVILNKAVMGEQNVFNAASKENKEAYQNIHHY